MTELTIEEMLKLVPEGESRLFERTVPEPSEERYFEVAQNWDYRPGRLKWLNSPGFEQSPRPGSRWGKHVPLAVVPRPDVTFKGRSKDVVDFYSTGSQAYFISDPLFRLIEQMDPGSLEDVEFTLHARDGDLPFHAVMPRRLVDPVDVGRTDVLITYDGSPGFYVPRVRFPNGAVFDNEALGAAAHFAALDSPFWYWSRGLLDLAAAQGIRGLFARSAASSPPRPVVRL